MWKRSEVTRLELEHGMSQKKEKKKRMEWNYNTNGKKGRLGEGDEGRAME